MAVCFEDHTEIATSAHGKGQEDAVNDIARWLELRAQRRAGPAKPEDCALASMLRTGDWRTELQELEQCK